MTIRCPKVHQLLCKITLLWVVAACLSSQTSAPPPAASPIPGIEDISRARLMAWQAAGKADGNLSQALALAERLTGTPRIVVAASERALPGVTYAGSVINICVFDRGIPSEASAGKVRVTSETVRYDSGDQPLTLETFRQSLCYHWDTAGLPPRTDYAIYVAVSTRAASRSATAAVINAAGPALVIRLNQRAYEPFWLDHASDAYAPAAGFPLEFRRVWPQDAANSPYLGPLGRGWMHAYDVHLQEFADGRIAFLGADGFNRWFRSTPDGRYLSSPGDFAQLARAADGSFTLTEKDKGQYGFTSFGQLSYLLDANGNRVTATYSASKLSSVSHSSGAVFRFTYNSAGRLATLTDHNGHQTQFKYDVTGEFLTSVTSTTGAVTSYTYNGTSGLPPDYRLLSITRPDASHLFFTYDFLGRLASRSGDGDAGKLTYTYGADGATRIQDSVGAATTIRVNDARRPTEIRDALNGVTRFTYDAQVNLIGISDALGRLTRMVYDENGNIIQYDDAAGTVTWDYERSFNHPAWVQDSAGNVTSFSYDARGNLAGVVYPDNSREAFSYDEHGALSAMTNRQGQTVLYASDARGLMTSKTYPDKSVTLFSYDASLNLVAATNGQGTVSLQYDSADRLTSLTYPGGRAFRYVYDAAGKRTQMIDPDGGTLNYAYDPVGRLSRMESGTGALLVSYQYDSANRIILRTLGNGVTAKFEYDAGGQLSRLTNLGPSGSELSHSSYTYDAVGNPLSRQTSGGITTYSYDALDRLASVRPETGPLVQFSYDSLGNRKAVTTAGVAEQYTVNRLNQYTAVGAAALKYDLNGALTSRPTSAGATQYDYDAEGRLVAFRGPAGTGTYAYDALGYLYTRTDTKGTSHFLRDGLQVSVQENDAHQSIARNFWGQSDDEILEQEPASAAPPFYAQDLQGNVSEVTDSSGRVVESYRYDAFGTLSNPGSLGTPFLFAGAYYDQVAGLSYFRTRWYSPDLGRFVQPNVAGLGGGLNLYTYAFANPIRFRDPLGAAGGVGGGPGGVGTITSLVVASGAVGGPLSYAPEQWSVVRGPVGLQPGEGAPRSPVFPRGRGRSALGAVPAFGGGATGAGGGACPTFIQVPDKLRAPPTTPLDVSRSRLAAKITVPIDGALVRADVPVFGVAGGTAFKEYRVEYGPGREPTEWHLISSSYAPQPRTDVGLSEMRLMQGDLDIRGNLVTWNTGLKNWVHLPWHPPEDPTDLNGVYTLRLLVFGTDGEKSEDRVTVTVGRAIAQALPGDALSPDHRVRMHFRAQSLTRPFRVYSILPLAADGVRLPSPALSPAYEVSPAGDRFIKDVALEFLVSPGESPAQASGRLGIAQFSSDKSQWEWLPSESISSGFGVILRTMVSELPLSRAIYAVGIRPGGIPDGTKSPPAPPPSLRQSSPGTLISETFEKTFGTWKSTDKFVGAVLARDNDATPDGSYALRLTNPSASGNFSVSILDSAFDAAQYPIMGFDYRIGPGVKTDFYLSIAGRWYQLAFSGEPTNFRNRDVNIANLGRIEGVVADDKWHHAQVDLSELLRPNTAHTRIDEIRMADWNATGYMKLDFGRNPRGAVYYMDNFRLSSPGRLVSVQSVVLDNFAMPGMNALGGATGTFSAPGTDLCHAELADGILKVAYDTVRSGSWCGYYTVLKGFDLDRMGSLSLRVKGPLDASALVGLRDAATQREVKVALRPYLRDPDPLGWQAVRVPLSVFRGLGLQGLKSIDLLSVTFENKNTGRKSVLEVADLRVEPDLSFPAVLDMTRFPLEHNLLGGGFHATAQGAGAISAGYHEEMKSGSPERSVRISYGGNIGLNYGGGGFSYAVWETDLLGFDARPYDSIVLRLRGQKGGERPNISLDDGTVRRCIRAKEFAAITDTWQEVTLPLKTFSDAGIDLSHLQALQLDFEWEEMAGTVYVTDVRFANALPTQPGCLSRADQ